MLLKPVPVSLIFFFYFFLKIFPREAKAKKKTATNFYMLSYAIIKKMIFASYRSALQNDQEKKTSKIQLVSQSVSLLSNISLSSHCCGLFSRVNLNKADVLASRTKLFPYD